MKRIALQFSIRTWLGVVFLLALILVLAKLSLKRNDYLEIAGRYRSLAIEYELEEISHSATIIVCEQAIETGSKQRENHLRMVLKRPKFVMTKPYMDIINEYENKIKLRLQSAQIDLEKASVLRRYFKRLEARYKRIADRPWERIGADPSLP